MGTETKKDITRLAFAIVLISGLGISGAFLEMPDTVENVAAVNAAADEWINPDTGTVGAPQQVQTRTETVQWTNPDARQGGQNIPFGSGTTTKEVDSTDEEKDVVSVAGNLLAQSLQQCDTEGSGGCKNLCSTSYIIPALGTYQIRDCYESANEDAPRKAIVQLQQCIERETGTAVPAEEDPIKEALCIGNVANVGLAECKGGNCTAKGTVLDEEARENPEAKLIVPSACKKEFEAVRKLRNVNTAQGSATTGEVAICAHKGPVVCYPRDFSNLERGYTCIIKDPSKRGSISGINGGISGSTRQCTGTVTERVRCEVRILSSRTSTAWKSVGIAIGQGIGTAFTQLQASYNRSSSGSSSSQGCSAGYVKAVVDGRTVCKKESGTTPQCLLVASKEEILSGEKVVIRWRTSNAETVHINGIGTDLPKSSQTTIQPTETTTYELTAIGKDADNKKLCEVTVTVKGGGTLGPTGSAPPQLSCEPNAVRVGKPTTIKWACTALADGTEGIGIDTEGKLSGEVAVVPEYNTEYGVSCLEEDIEIGRNMCAVTVGEPLYDIVAEPLEAERGDRVRVAWSSLFMKSCRVQGPRGFDFSNTQGVIITEPFSFDKETVPDRQIRAAIYTLECESQFGTQVTKDVTVDFKPEE